MVTLSVFTGKTCRTCLCFITGPRFPERAEPRRPAHSSKAASCRSETSSKFIHDSSILTPVGISRFLSIVASGSPLPDESITPRQPELEGELRSTGKELGRGAEPTWPRARSSPPGGTGTMSKGRRGPARALRPQAPHRATSASTSTTRKTEPLKRREKTTIPSAEIWNS